jgi:hypothetical protein
MKKPGKARLLIRCRQLTVVSCIPKVARGVSSNQSAAIVSWHSTVGQAKTSGKLRGFRALSRGVEHEGGILACLECHRKVGQKIRKEAEIGLSITVSVRALR